MPEPVKTWCRKKCRHGSNLRENHKEASTGVSYANILRYLFLRTTMKGMFDQIEKVATRDSDEAYFDLGKEFLRGPALRHRDAQPNSFSHRNLR